MNIFCSNMMYSKTDCKFFFWGSSVVIASYFVVAKCLNGFSCLGCVGNQINSMMSLEYGTNYFLNLWEPYKPTLVLEISKP
jgi:hypothetical protein